MVNGFRLHCRDVTRKLFDSHFFFFALVLKKKGGGDYCDIRFYFLLILFIYLFTKIISFCVLKSLPFSFVLFSKDTKIELTVPTLPDREAKKPLAFLYVSIMDSFKRIRFLFSIYFPNSFSLLYLLFLALISVTPPQGILYMRNKSLLTLFSRRLRIYLFIFSYLLVQRTYTQPL